MDYVRSPEGQGIPAANSAAGRYGPAGQSYPPGNGMPTAGYAPPPAGPPPAGPPRYAGRATATTKGSPTFADRDPTAPPIPVKILIAGGFGVGKTTAVGAISEIKPLTTEAVMTSAAIGIDDPGSRTDKTTTTVAMDFGRVTIDRSLKLYLFGTPGQTRFGFMWDDLARGALGALVVVDASRLDDCYPVIDFFEQSELPFVVAVNAFDGRLVHELDAIRWALAIGEHVPLVRFDARDRLSVRDALLVVLDRALQRANRAQQR